MSGSPETDISSGVHKTMPAKTISENRAKQGRRGQHVLAILLSSLALALVAALLLGLI